MGCDVKHSSLLPGAGRPLPLTFTSSRSPALGLLGTEAGSYFLLGFTRNRPAPPPATPEHQPSRVHAGRGQARLREYPHSRLLSLGSNEDWNPTSDPDPLAGQCSQLWGC